MGAPLTSKTDAPGSSAAIRSRSTSSTFRVTSCPHRTSMAYLRRRSRRSFGASMRPMIDNMFASGHRADASQSLESAVQNITATGLADQVPAHAHSSKPCPRLAALLSASPPDAKTTPNLSALVSKLGGFLEAVGTEETRKAAATFRLVSDYLGKPNAKPAAGLLTAWTDATKTSLAGLSPAQAFPVCDLLRVGVLRPAVAQHFAAQPAVLDAVFDTLDAGMAGEAAANRPLRLTTHRLLINALLSPAFTTPTFMRQILDRVVVGALVADAVDESAATLAFACARSARAGSKRDEDLDVELASAVAEAIGRDDLAPGVGASCSARSSSLPQLFGLQQRWAPSSTSRRMPAPCRSC